MKNLSVIIDMLRIEKLVQEKLAILDDSRGDAGRSTDVFIQMRRDTRQGRHAANKATTSGGNPLDGGIASP